MKCISISFKTAPENIREKFAFTNSEKESFIKKANSLVSNGGMIILNTCNRTEIYTKSEKYKFSILEELLSQKSGLNISEIRKYARYYENRQAIEHLFKVTCGLDSMIIGENEILSQVKQAFLNASENNQTDFELNTAFLGALSCAKKVKTQTEISKSALSIATLACKTIKNHIEENNIKSPTILIIGGSGQTGSTVIKNLLNKKDGIKIIATKRAHRLSSEFDKKIITINYEERYNVLKEADIVLSATQSPHYTMNYNDVKSKINNKNLLFIDLASPYDVDREIEKLENCSLITLDYFEKLSRKNNQKKEKATLESIDIIENELQKLYKNISIHNAESSILRWKSKYKDESFEKFLYYLKDKLNADSFDDVIEAIKRESLVS